MSPKRETSPILLSLMKRFIILSTILFIALSTSAQETLTLEQVKERALTHNIKMRAADNAIEQAKEQKKEAFTHYFPQVNAVGMAFKSNTEMLKTEIQPAKFIPASLAAAIPPPLLAGLPTNIPISMVDGGTLAGVAAIQPLFLGGQIINGNKLAKIGIKVSELKKEVAVNEVEQTAEQYFWQIVALKEKQKTLNAVAEMLTKLEKDANVAVKAGVRMRNDLLQVQIKQNEIESMKLQLQNGLSLAKMVLAQYIGTEGEIDVQTQVNPTELPPYPSLKTDHSAAVAATPEYQLLEQAAKAATLQRKIESGKRLPTVAVGVGYNHHNLGTHLENNFGAVFATVSVPLSQWWGGTHATKRKRLAEQQAIAELNDKTELLKIRMQKSWNNLDNAYKQLLIAKKSIEQSEENLRLNQNFYQAGTITMNDLLDAQRLYQQSRDRYTEDYIAFQNKILEYQQNTGQ